jgi:MFS transporter, putative metabolite:H+ symporter
MRSEARALNRSQSVSQLVVGQRTELVDRDGRSVTVADKINDIGFGNYHIQVFILCSGFVIAEAGSLGTASGLSEAIRVQYHLITDFERSFHMLMTFLGFALGTLASGLCGDALGRRAPMFVGYIGLLIADIGVFLAPNYLLLLWGFFSVGFFAALGVPAAFITIAEVTPTRLRGVTNAAMSIAFCLGELWSALGLRIILPKLVGSQWRLVLLWSAVPAVALLLFGLFSRVTRYDTPAFLGVRGRSQELVGLINLMAEMNGKSASYMCLDEEVTIEKEDVLSLRQALVRLTTYPQMIYLMTISFLFFVKDMAFYGMGVFWPLAWSQGMKFGVYPATEMILTASLGLPGVAVAMALIYLLPRRLAYSLGALLAASGVVAIQGILDGQMYTGLAGVIFFKLFYPTQQMTTFLFPSEVFSTQVRVWSMSIIGFVGRSATLLAPVVVNSSKHNFLLLNSSLMCAALLAVWSLPETKDLELLHSSDTSEQAKVSSKQDFEANYGSVESK